MRVKANAMAAPHQPRLWVRLTGIGLALAIAGAVVHTAITSPAPAPATVAAPVSDEPIAVKAPPAAWTSPDRAAPIEADAVLPDEFKQHLEYLDALVGVIRSSGYKCPSVSGISAFSGTIHCDHYQYSYTVRKDPATGIQRAIPE